MAASFGAQLPSILRGEGSGTSEGVVKLGLLLVTIPD